MKRKCHGGFSDTQWNYLAYIPAPAVKGYHACRLQDKNIHRFYTFASSNTCQRTSMYQCFLAVKSHIPPLWDANLTLSAGILGPWNDYFTGRHTFRRNNNNKKKCLVLCADEWRRLPAFSHWALDSSVKGGVEGGDAYLCRLWRRRSVRKGGSLLVTHDFRHWLAHSTSPHIEIFEIACYQMEQTDRKLNDSCISYQISYQNQSFFNDRLIQYVGQLA